jgi:predicted MPP superfamily phosphohydrolase
MSQNLTIQIVSDLHLEFHADKLKFNIITPSAKILALVGDICCWSTNEDLVIAKRFFEEILPQFEHIIYIAGNHEYYNYGNKKLTITDIDARISLFCKKLSNKIHFMNNNSIELLMGKQKYLILGSTLWTYIPDEAHDFVKKNMSDYDKIYINNEKVRLITPKDITALFYKNYKYLKTQMTRGLKNGCKVIILTHHKPYNNPNHNELTLDSAYSTDCTDIIKKPLALWAYGHTHIKDNTTINGVTLYSNPKGYINEKTLYNKKAAVSL